ncbi:MAG: hypothetical protein H6977_10450 [Gammaproteobacteria bacterium]|nr:hypothetical protein [Gammaproteobacteria bacterium]
MRKTSFSAALWLACLWLGPGAATAAVLVDDFNTAQTVTSATGGVAAVSGPGILGGAREVRLSQVDGDSQSFTAAGGIATFSSSAGASNSDAYVFYDGRANGVLEWPPQGPGLGGVDVLQGELFAKFRLDVTAITGVVGFQAGFVNPATGLIDLYSSTVLSEGINPPGAYHSELQVGPAALGNDALAIVLRVFSLSPGDSISFSGFGIALADEPLPQAVPLPGALTLAGPAVLALLGRGKPRRRSVR